MIDRVKDESITLNTAQSGNAEASTSKINGILKAIIVSTTSPIQINVSIGRKPIFPFEKTAFIIYENADLKMDKYIPIRLPAIRGDGESKDFNQVEWVLNDKLRILIKGARNTNVNVTLRYI